MDRFTPQQEKTQLFLTDATSNFWSYPIFDYASLYRMKMISEFLGDVKGKRAIDVGCGNGSISLLLWLLGVEVHSMDLSYKALQVNRSLRYLNKRSATYDPNLCHSDAMKLPYQDETFDIVCCLEALEFVKDDIPAIQEIERVAKKDAVVILFIPYDPRVTETQESFGYYRRYTFKTIKQKMEAKQLRVERIDFWYFPMLKLFDLMRLRYFFAFFGLFIDQFSGKTIQRQGGFRNKKTFIDAFMKFYTTKFWRRAMVPLFMRLLDLDKPFQNAPYAYPRSRAQANDIFVILRKVGSTSNKTP
jgi:ubiquinone/menaquinone biosynthesis C-methylase UbiE